VTSGSPRADSPTPAPSRHHRPGAAFEHAFDHRPAGPRGDRRRGLAWALALNVALLLVEMLGGIMFGSLALLADAAHLCSDVVGLGIALAAVVLAARPAAARHSFGFARAEVLAAQAGAVMLVATACWISVEAAHRVQSPGHIDGTGMAAVAGLGIVANLASAVLVHRVQGESLNMRASYLHLATDAAGSALALIAGLMIAGWGWTWTDAGASWVTAVLVAWAGWHLLHEATHVLMEGVPRGLDPDAVITALSAVEGVASIHHLHVWNLASDVPALSAHVVVQGQPSLHEAYRTVQAARTVLADHFRITNATLELEPSPGAGAFPHPDAP